MRIGFLSGRREDDASPAARMHTRPVAEAAQPPPLNDPAMLLTPDMLGVSRPKSAFERLFEAQPEAKLAADVAGFRDGIASALYEQSQDYRTLCSLTHSGLVACDDIVAELRRRLAGNPHYEVLRKLDEAHAVASAATGR